MAEIESLGRQAARQGCQTVEAIHRGSVDRCRVSNSKQTMCQSGHRSIGGHRVAFLVRTVRLCKPRAAEIGLQRQSLVLLAIAERSLADLHPVLSGGQAGRPEIPAHRDAP
jgi:hypothetical protein